MAANSTKKPSNGKEPLKVQLNKGKSGGLSLDEGCPNVKRWKGHEG